MPAKKTPARGGSKNKSKASTQKNSHHATDAHNDHESSFSKRTLKCFTTNVIISGAHFQLFNDCYDVGLDVAELGRHIWGCEMTTADAIAMESASLKDFLASSGEAMGLLSSTANNGANSSSNSGGGKRKGSSAANAPNPNTPEGRIAAAIAAANAGSPGNQTGLSVSGAGGGGGTSGDGLSVGNAVGINDGAVLRIRFPRTIAFRERELSSSSSSSSEEDSTDEDAEGAAKVGGKRQRNQPHTDNDAATASLPLMLTTDDLPQLSILSTMYESQAHHNTNTGGLGGVGASPGSNLYSSDLHVPSATPILASTIFGGGGLMGGALGGAPPTGSTTGSAVPGAVASLPSVVNQSSIFGMGGGGGAFAMPSLLGTNSNGNNAGGNSTTGGGSGFSQLYQSVLPSGAHGLLEGAKGTGEASVDDLMALTTAGQAAAPIANATAPHQPQGFAMPVGRPSTSGSAVGGGMGGGFRFPPSAAPPAAADNAGSGGGGSLFDMAARFTGAKVELSQQPLLTAADLLLGGDGKATGDDDTLHSSSKKTARQRRRIIERINFDSIFCTVSRKGGVSVFGPIAAEELFAVCQMAHEYLGRAIVGSCPWAVTLSATSRQITGVGSSNSAASSSLRQQIDALPGISPKEMFACGSAAAWREHAQGRYREHCARLAKEAVRKRAEEAAAAAEAAAAEKEDADGGFALPFAPPPKASSAPSAMLPPAMPLNPMLRAALKANSGSNSLMPMPMGAGSSLGLSIGSIGASTAAEDVLGLRIKRLRGVLSLSLEAPQAATAAPAIEGMLAPPALTAPIAAVEHVAQPTMVAGHGLRVSNIMCHLLWSAVGWEALQRARGETAAAAAGGAVAKPPRRGSAAANAAQRRHFTVSEFEQFTTNVGRWALMRKKATATAEETAAAPKPGADVKSTAAPKTHSRKVSSASFSSAAANPTAGLLDDAASGDEWRPLGVVIVLAATQDYCRFEWNFEGRVTEVIAQRRSATFRVVISKAREDCSYVADVLVPTCLEIL